MLPKRPLSGICLAIKTGLSSSLNSVARAQPQFPPRSGAPSVPKPKSTMGRSGYDTTNMKVATKPRPAGATKNTASGSSSSSSSGGGASKAAGTGMVLPQAPGGGGQSKGMSTTGQSRQSQQGHVLAPRLPTHQEIWGDETSNTLSEDVPPPRLVGRGCSFYP